jgi:hypothetical protein
MRAAELGEGQPSAAEPVATKVWRTRDEIAELFRAPGDPEWTNDRDRIDQRVFDPFAR